MKKNRQPDRKEAVPVEEKDLRFAQGAEEKQHVDNPGQTPMKDGPS